jgi:HEPN domain-containing protein
MTNVKELQVTGTLAKRYIGLLFNAYRDYKVARLLFNSNLLREACCIGNQALEKQMKVYIEANGGKTNKGHNTVNLFNTMHHMKLKNIKELNSEFFKVLTKVYDTRYYESLPHEYRYTILRNKFLAELDFSYSALRTLVTIKPSENVTGGVSEFDNDIEQRNPILFDNNYILLGLEKAAFLNRPELVEEFIMFGNTPWTIYQNLPYSRDNGRFVYSGLKVINPKTMNLTDWDNEEFND